MTQLYRVKHDVERGKFWRSHTPEVYVLSGKGEAIPLNKDWQLFSYDMNQPGMLPKKWRVMYGWNTAFTNHGAGYDHPGSKPKQDWVNKRDLNAKELPRFDKARICGGAVVTGTPGFSVRTTLKDAQKLIQTLQTKPRSLLGRMQMSLLALIQNNILWIAYLDGNNPPPSLDNLPVWLRFVALNVVNKTTLSRFPYRGGQDVLIPLLARSPVYLNLSDLELWTSPTLPDPYKIYVHI